MSAAPQPVDQVLTDDFEPCPKGRQQCLLTYDQVEQAYICAHCGMMAIEMLDDLGQMH